MDHRAFVQSLRPEERARLTEKSDRAGLVHLAVHFGAILVLGYLIGERIPAWPALLLPQGILIVFLFTLLHEAVHRTAFRSPWLNRWTARICGFLIFLPVEWFRCFHFAHHRHTQDPESDPELATPKPATTLQYAIHMSGLPVWRSQAATLIANATGRGDDAFVPASARTKIRDEARGMLAAYAVIAGLSVLAGSAEPVYVWILPLLLGQPFLRLYLLAEHGRCPFVADMLDNSRTTHTSRLVRWLAWNMPYHCEHHSFPAVPWHRLPALHAMMRDHLRQTENGYARFHRKYIASLPHPSN